MRLPNGYGGVVKLSGARRRPYAARVTTGWYYNDQTGKRVQRYQILGYAATRAEALQILARYNDYPIDGASLKLTFADIYERWYNDCSACEYLIHTMDSEHFTYHNYYSNFFKPLLNRLGIDRTPHCCRHTTISMMADAHIDQTSIKKIVGHAGAMSLTERVYTHLDVNELIEAIDRI